MLPSHLPSAKMTMRADNSMQDYTGLLRVAAHRRGRCPRCCYHVPLTEHSLFRHRNVQIPAFAILLAHLGHARFGSEEPPLPAQLR